MLVPIGTMLPLKKVVLLRYIIFENRGSAYQNEYLK